MPSFNTDSLRGIKTLPQLIKYLRDELDWPIDQDAVEDDLTFEYQPEELGISSEGAVAIKEIKQIRPLDSRQPWGVFWVSFEKKRLPVVMLRRILGHLVVKRRAAADRAKRRAWHLHDLLFISSCGEESDRAITFAHFSQDPDNSGDLPVLKVLGWDGADTVLHLADAHETLAAKLRWPDDPTDLPSWRVQWAGAFRHRLGHTVRTANDLAEVLAALARGIRDRCQTILAKESDRGPLTKLFKAFQAALIHDLTPATFADTYAQTITYGLFTAAVNRTDMSGGAEATFVKADDMALMARSTSPFLKEMLETFLHAGGRKNGVDFDELGIQDVVDLLRGDETDLPAILRDFGNRTRGEDPVIYFYERFLSAYNKKLKVQRGVFYTPRPVVSYIVRSVHELLQTEFGLEDGLASTVTWGEMLKKHPSMKLPPLTDEHNETRTISPDEPFVQILDPATGTATFLVETTDVIFNHLKAKWNKGGLAAMPRLAKLGPRTPADFSAYWNAYVPAALLPRLHGYELLAAPYAIAHLKFGLKLTETGYHFAGVERARIYLTNALEPWVKQLPLIGFDPLAHEAEAVNKIKRHTRFTVVVGNPPYSGESANKIESVERDVKETYQTVDGVPLKEKGKKNWLLDDYVKFLRLSHKTVAVTGHGFVGHIINNAFQDNPTFRGLRRSLVSAFSSIRILDLHGSGTRAEANEEAQQDENVFDILQGVCVLLLSRPAQRQRGMEVTRGDLWGHRDRKYKLLAETTPAALIKTSVQPKADQWYFIPLDLTHEAEWMNCIGLLEAFPVNGNGLISAKDHFAYAVTPEEFEKDLEVFLNPRLTDGVVAERLGIRDNSMWSLHDGRIRLRRERGQANFCKVAYRPFDTRHSLFHRDVIFNLRLPVTQHIVEGKNLVLLTTRMTKGDEWRHCFVTRSVSDCAFLSNQTSTNAFVFPLKQKRSSDGLFAGSGGYDANITPRFMTAVSRSVGISLSMKASKDNVTPEDIFHYAYAVFHSPGYRRRYAEFLKIDFPRLPLTSSLELFRSLSKLGGELVALHLLESPKVGKFITEYVGGRAPEVEKVSWSDKTVWLDKAQTVGFKGVPENVWNFHIGGYQVCEKWLKDRKGRKLLKDDIEHYQKIVVALSETIRLMAEIDQVIEKHGGWPGAFVTGQPDTQAVPARQSPVTGPKSTRGSADQPRDLQADLPLAAEESTKYGVGGDRKAPK